MGGPWVCEAQPADDPVLSHLVARPPQLVQGEARSHRVRGLSAATGGRLLEEGELLALAGTALGMYETHREQEWLVSPGAPVLFFGNLLGFRASRPRVATVGLNPSRLEFPGASPFGRFPDADSGDEHSYLQSLYSYFRIWPYRGWFDFYEQALQGMGASYYGERANVALHTDIGSVLPTDPTWSGLDASVRRRLAEVGGPFWHLLIECLQPDILLISMRRRWLESVEFTPCGDWQRIHGFDFTTDGERRKRPVGVHARWHTLSSGMPVLLAHVPASQKPLAALSHQQRRLAGTKIKEYWQQASDNRRFVQFPHPGGEHSPDSRDWKKWNPTRLPNGKENPHRRKFLELDGAWVRNWESEEICEGKLWAWGEWEPESRVLRRFGSPVAGKPRYLYQPTW